MRIKAITNEQQKILFGSLIVGGSIIVLLFFIYLPQRAKFIAINQKLTVAEAEIAQLNTLIQGQDLIESVQELNEQLKGMAARLPTREEEVIRALSEEAGRVGIRIKNVVPSAREPLNKEVAGYPLEKQRIAMEFVCNFKTFGEYLHTLRNDFPFLVTIEKFMIEGQGEGVPDLKINMHLSVYLTKRSS